jgi:competence protein ComEC
MLLLAGMISVINYDSRNAASYFSKYPADALIVKVNNEPQFKNGFLRFTVNAEASSYKGSQRLVSGTLLLTMPADSARAAGVNYGDELLIPAKYNPVDPPFNPAEFNYKQHLARQNIYAQAFIDPQEVHLLNRDAGNSIVAYALKQRQRLIRQFKQYMHNPAAISVASTLILGYRAELDNDILQAYSKTGTIHVLSVSGAHVAIIWWLINLLLGFLDRYRYGRLLKAGLSIVLIWYYSVLTGLSPAVCRAAVMISLIIIGKTFNRRINTLNILAVSAMLLLLFDPFLLTDVGFQLSYLAVAGLIVFQPIVYNWLDIENKWLDKLWLLCSVSIAAQAITFPLGAYYFHQFPVYFLVSNLFILLPSFVIMCAGMGFLLLAQFNFTMLAKITAAILEQTILFMNKGLQLIEHSPYALVGKIWITDWELWLMLGVVALLFCLVYYKKSGLLITMMSGVLILCSSWSLKRIAGQRVTNATFFNLKKHTAILFKQGNRGVLLTDITDTDKSYQYSVQPCLDSMQVSQLTLIPFTGDISTGFLLKKGDLVRFMDKDMLVIDRPMYDDHVSSKQQADYLFVSGSPHISLEVLNNYFNYTTLIADANNSDKTIALLKAGANKYDKKINVLKHNKSLIIQSN